jgi:hypothetical protein
VTEQSRQPGPAPRELCRCFHRDASAAVLEAAGSVVSRTRVSEPSGIGARPRVSQGRRGCLGDRCSTGGTRVTVERPDRVGRVNHATGLGGRCSQTADDVTRRRRGPTRPSLRLSSDRPTKVCSDGVHFVYPALIEEAVNAQARLYPLDMSLRVHIDVGRDPDPAATPAAPHGTAGLRGCALGPEATFDAVRDATTDSALTAAGRRSRSVPAWLTPGTA